MSNAEPVELYMVPLDNLPFIYETEKLSSAITLFRESLNKGGSCKGSRLLLVKNDRGEFTGLLTVKRLLAAAAFRVLEKDPLYKSENFSWHYVKKARENGIPVREVMRPLGMYTVERRKNIASAARMFVKHGISFLPVTDGKKIIGVLSARELFYRHYHNTRFEDNLNYEHLKTSTGGKIVNEPATV